MASARVQPVRDPWMFGGVSMPEDDGGSPRWEIPQAQVSTAGPSSTEDARSPRARGFAAIRSSSTTSAPVRAVHGTAGDPANLGWPARAKLEALGLQHS